MFFLTLILPALVELALYDKRRGVQPFDRLYRRRK